MTIQQELLALKNEQGLWQPEDVVSWAAANPQSKLHGQFEWNDKKAGHEHRLWQARRLLAIHITFEDGERRTVNLRFDRHTDFGGYRDIPDVLRDKTLHEHMMSEALADLNRLQVKYQRLNELKPVWAEVEKVSRRRGRRKPETQPEVHA